ncbi:MAG: hypothetical protein JSW07_01760 [bacterium]|nr:MAG: hypothetical protein JSW07_01760 [bacterium]
MISQTVLFEAKAFLCWDKFPHLSIKLIPIDEVSAFFYPPAKDILTINLFYEKRTHDFSRAIFLLFHEAGHLRQWQYLSAQARADEFWHFTHLDKGDQKIRFEREAWNYGEELLSEFLVKINMDQNNLINVYKSYAKQSLLTYT